MLIIKCPRCGNSVTMMRYFDEYLCQGCLKKETKPFRQRQAEANIISKSSKKAAQSSVGIV